VTFDKYSFFGGIKGWSLCPEFTAIIEKKIKEIEI
jgi:hypothetical protein